MSRIWQQNFKKLCDYKELHGDTNVPKSYSDTKLARLVISLRQQKRNNTLKPERELALRQIGFDFDPHETKWQSNFQSVVEFYRLNGHSSPNRRSENEHERALAEWVHRMHKLVREGQLSSDKIDQLRLVNIDGSPAEHHLNQQGIPHCFAAYMDRLKIQIQKTGPLIDNRIADRELYDWLVLQHQRINAALILPREYSNLIRTNFSLKLANSDNIVNFEKKSA